MAVESMTHDEIGVLAAKKLRNMGYIAAMANLNLGTGGEQPDAMGVKSCGETYLVEVKVSRSDFLADKHKPWRSDKTAIGNYRAYCTPKGLLKPEEIPYGWQLWEVHGKTKPIIKVIKGEVIRSVKHPEYSWEKRLKQYVNCDRDEFNHFYKANHYRSVAGCLASIIDRMIKDGVDVNRYAATSKLD